MKNNKSKGKSIVYSIYLILIILISVLFLGIATGDTPGSLFGYTIRLVITGSMEPTIKTNSINIIKRCAIDDIEIGDILCFNYGQDIAHRVIEKYTNDNGDIILHTKGDANELPDNLEINKDMVVGKVVKTFNFVSSILDKYSISPGNIDTASISRSLLIIIIICIFAVNIIYILIKTLIILINGLISHKKDNLSEFNNLFDELEAYREMIDNLDKLDDESLDVKEHRIECLGNKVSNIIIQRNNKALQHNIKQYRKNLKRAMVIKGLCEKLDNRLND